METKLISVVMSIKNKLQMTEECIKSIRENTKHLGEIIIIDDHSEEDISKIEGVRYYLNRGTGIYTAWNYGAELAKFPYVAFINNDILFSKDWDVPLVEVLDENVWIACPYHTSGALPEDFPEGKGRHSNMAGGIVGLPFIGSCFIMEKKHWDIIQPVPECLKLWYGDNYVWESVVQEHQCREIKESYVHHFMNQTMDARPQNPRIAEDKRLFAEIYKQKGWGVIK